MSNWSVEKIQSFFTHLNEHFGLSVNPVIKVGEKNSLPLKWHEGNMLFIPDFFNDEELEEDVRVNLLLIMYSAFYRAKHNDNHIGMHPMFMVKGICNELGIRFLTDNEIETNLRKVRRKLYKNTDYACLFKGGYELREDAWTRYKVTKVDETEDDILVTVKPIGINLGMPEKVFTEEELYNKTCVYEPIDNVKVDMRSNIVLISGPSGVGKTTIMKELMRQDETFNKPVSVTTRKPRSDETYGKDYYFTSKEEFYDYVSEGALIEHTIYNGECYGTLLSEIDKYPTDRPLVLVADVGGRRNILRHFPLSTTIFIQPPSNEELKKRIESRGVISEDEIAERVEIAFEEMEEAKYYDYVVINDNQKKCIKEIKNIINKNRC